jgi:outer membrane lipoprotein-sorting protein
MFRKFLASLLLVAALVPAVHAQTVDEILAKHYEAQGGLDKIKAMQSIRLMGKMEVGPGMEAPLTMDKKRPALSRMEFVFSGMTGVQAYDGKQAWALMPFMGQKTAEPASEEESKMSAAQADFDGPLFDYKAKGHTIELAGKEAVDGADAYKLKVTRKDGHIEYYYVDAETYLVVKRESKETIRGTEMETESSFGNFKEVNGMMFPFSMTMGAKGSDHKQTITIDSIAVNVPMEMAHFTMPAAADSAKGGAASAAAAPAGKGNAAAAADAKSTATDKKKK